MKISLLIASLSFLAVPPPLAEASCQGHIVGSNRIFLSDYDPFAPTDARSPQTLSVHNHSDEGCRYRIALIRTPPNDRLGQYLNYNLTTPAGVSLLQSEDAQLDTGKLLQTSNLLPNNTGSVSYSVFLGRGQFAPPGVYGDHFLAILLSDHGSAELDRKSILLLQRVQPIANVSIAGGGLATSINFGYFHSGERRSVVLQAQSNEAYTIRLSSQHKSRLNLDPPITGQNWSVDYRMEVDGAAADLTGDAALVQAGMPSAGLRSHSLSFKILDIANKRAGLYKDVVTATISPNH
ncbi:MULTISPECIES: hypothetical protein [Rhodomicrobium]|uniref:hypothetical protein n=1 Tax=Rhodomicrobium TaxID=1068 RepID=UPI000B4B9751|nr:MULTISPECIES: hypothetical protein [Rhodomicrobium]